MSLLISPSNLGGPPLTRDYLAGIPAAREFFTAGDPFSLATYLQHWKLIRARTTREDREIAAAAFVPTSSRAQQRLAQWVAHGGGVVTTGQQAGLFSGPLFTLYKALTAVRLARTLETELGELVLPVFWIASEDHDWEEIDHTYLVDPRHRLVRLSATPAEPTSTPLPAAERTLSGDIETTIDTFAQVVKRNAFDARYLTYIREEYSAGRGVVEAFAGVMRRVLEPWDMYLVDAADPAVKRGSAGVLRRAVEDVEGEERVLRETEAALAGRGYPVQVAIPSRSPNVFVRTAAGRERVVRAGSEWMAWGSGVRLGSGEPSELIGTEPGRVSPNVLLRPVVESRVFPVLAYVAGPGEIAYWGQLAGLFARQGVPMPPVYPRSGFLILEEEVRRSLDDLGLSVGEARRPVHELVEQRARSLLPPELTGSLATLRRLVTEAFEGVTPSARALDPTLVGAVGRTRNRALLEAARLERKIIRAQKRGDTGWAELLERVRAHVWPLAQPQERVLNGIPYLARHGELLLEEVYSQIATPLTRADESAVARAEGAGTAD